MKKVLLLALMTVLSFSLSSCKDDTFIDDGNQTITYDDRSLVTEECTHLDNLDEVWQPVWCEEFNYTGLPDPDKWGYNTGGGGFGNHEEQYYTYQDEDNAYVSDGTLKITALKESVTSVNDYTSARLTSKYYGEWEYGRIQISAKMPSGRGLWSAIWMLPTDNAYGGWPDSGEIDIMEYVGYQPNYVYGTIHTEAYNHNLGTQLGSHTTSDSIDTEFHLYEMIWEPASMKLLFDGNVYATFGYNPLTLTNIQVDNSASWPFDQAFHLILNIAVGGDWGGSQGIDESIFPQSMEVDYIRVYQQDYAQLDTTSPSAVDKLTVLDETFNSVRVMWDKATDDVIVKEYDVYVDDVLKDTTTLNSIRLNDLSPSTQYRIQVIAKDFAGNASDPVTLTIQTEDVRSIMGRIEAESYDNQSGVLTQVTTDTTGEREVTWISDNDYMEYLFSITEAGTYQVTYRYSSADPAEIKLYGKAILPISTTTLPSTGGVTTWGDVTSNTFTLTEGVYVLRIKASVGGFNLNYFEFEKVE